MTIAEKLLRAKTDIDEVYSKGFDVGFDEGKASFDGVSWDTIQDGGKRQEYDSAFSEWNSEYIRPQHKVIATVADGMFYQCKFLKKVEKEFFDLSQSSSQNNTFYGCSELEEIEDIGLNSNYYYQNTFLNCRKLHTIAKITVGENTNYNVTFMNCDALVNLTVAGTIGRSGFNLKWSTKLSIDSIISVLRALSDTTSGLSITLSQVAVDKAFGNGNIGTGINSAAWQEWVAEKSNWTINLA